MENKNKIIIYSVLALVAIIIVIVAIVYSKPKASNKSQKAGTQTTAPATPQGYNASVPKNIEVPNEGTTSTEKDVAVPKLQTNAAPGVTAQLRKFSVKAENNTFTPSKIIVYKGDTVHIDFTAVDKDYDFSIPAIYGISRQMAKGSTGPLEFQANTVGQFDIVCQACGGKKMGLLIVAPRK